MRHIQTHSRFYSKLVRLEVVSRMIQSPKIEFLFQIGAIRSDPLVDSFLKNPENSFYSKLVRLEVAGYEVSQNPTKFLFQIGAIRSRTWTD